MRSRGLESYPGSGRCAKTASYVTHRRASSIADRADADGMLCRLKADASVSRHRRGWTLESGQYALCSAAVKVSCAARRVDGLARWRGGGRRRHDAGRRAAVSVASDAAGTRSGVKTRTASARPSITLALAQTTRTRVRLQPGASSRGYPQEDDRRRRTANVAGRRVGRPRLTKMSFLATHRLNIYNLASPAPPRRRRKAGARCRHEKTKRGVADKITAIECYGPGSLEHPQRAPAHRRFA